MAVTRQTVLGTTTYTYYGTDHLGTVRAASTRTQAVRHRLSSSFDYEPFGLRSP